MAGGGLWSAEPESTHYRVKGDRMPTTPIKDMRRRQRRRRKVRDLRAKLAETTDSRRRLELIAKIRKLSPRAPIPEA